MSEKFTVINGDGNKTDDKQVKLEELYMKAFRRELAIISACNDCNQCRDNVKRAVFYAVKYYGLERIDRRHSGESRTLEQVKSDFSLLEVVKTLMGQLTPRELMSMFPIAKKYDGKKWDCKDYFFTVEKLKDFDLDTPLGDEGLEDFLWSYWNDDLFSFDSVSFSIISNMYRSQTGKGIMEEWCEKQGIPSYTIQEDIGVVKNNLTGEISKLSKKPSHLQIIK